MRHMLLTNDFPPKVGGIQSYLWELWRRLPPDDVVVYTASSHPEAERWDRSQAFTVVRDRSPVLLPEPVLARRARAAAAHFGARAVVIDPALPLGLLGPHLGLPYGVVLHGAEVTVPGRLPVTRPLLARAILRASLVVAAGGYPESEGRRAVGRARPFPVVAQVPPGVDPARFRPFSNHERAVARARWGLPDGARVVLTTSRLVPRKGVDTLLLAASRQAERHPGLTVVVGSAGRDRARLERLAAQCRCQVRFVGRVSDEELPALYACADIFALCCRSRWWGWEQEGFGIVLLEAAATGLPCITIDSGGVAEAVADGVTGLVVKGVDGHSLGLGPAGPREGQVAGTAAALGQLLDHPLRAAEMGAAGRKRAEEEFSYDALAARLSGAIDEWYQREVVDPY